MKIRGIAVAAAFLLGQAAYGGIITYEAALSGLAESPTNASPGIGEAIVTIDTILQTMEVNVTFSGLAAGNTASHIHCCTVAPDTGNAGVATVTPTFTGFPSGTTAGTYDHVFDLTLASSYNPSFVTAQGSLANAEAAFLAGMAAQETYLNIHTTAFPTGEIRGYLAVATPEPASLLLAGVALAGIGFCRRKRAV